MAERCKDIWKSTVCNSIGIETFRPHSPINMKSDEQLTVAHRNSIGVKILGVSGY